LTLDLENWHRRVLALGLRIFTSVAPLGYQQGIVQAVEAYSGRVVGFGPYDTGVVANHRPPQDQPFFELQGGGRVPRPGGSVVPRRAGDAINEGHRVALAL